MQRKLSYYYYYFNQLRKSRNLACISGLWITGDKIISSQISSVCEPVIVLDPVTFSHTMSHLDIHGFLESGLILTSYLRGKCLEFFLPDYR